MKGKATSSTGHLICGCGHEKLVHGTGMIIYGSDDTACAMVHCDCPEFLEEPREVRHRPRSVKTLDQEAPKLFVVTNAD